MKDSSRLPQTGNCLTGVGLTGSILTILARFFRATMLEIINPTDLKHIRLDKTVIFRMAAALSVFYLRSFFSHLPGHHKA